METELVVGILTRFGDGGGMGEFIGIFGTVFGRVIGKLGGLGIEKFDWKFVSIGGGGNGLGRFGGKIFGKFGGMFVGKFGGKFGGRLLV